MTISQTKAARPKKPTILLANPKGVLIKTSVGEPRGRMLSKLPCGPIQIRAVSQATKKSLSARIITEIGIAIMGLRVAISVLANLMPCHMITVESVTLTSDTAAAMTIPCVCEPDKDKLSVDNVQDQHIAYQSISNNCAVFLLIFGVLSFRTAIVP